MVKESQKVFRGYHPELHDQEPLDPRALAVSGLPFAEEHVGLPFVLEQHYNDVRRQ